MGELFVVSLGGSLVYPSEKGLDEAWLESFKEIVLEQVSKGNRFAIIVGGGWLAREYQRIAREQGVVDDVLLDQEGIRATWENAEHVKEFFEKEAGQDASMYSGVVKDYSQEIVFNEDILFGAGWKPGCSTDMDAVLIAEKLGSDKIINLSNIDYVYDKDPKHFDDAKKLESMSWDEFISLVGDVWVPGRRAPFDPIASKKAKDARLSVYIVGGKETDNINYALKGERFLGTIIRK